MNPIQTRQTYQYKHVRHHAKTSNSTQFFNLLTESQLFEQLETLLPNHRERLYPPTVNQ